MPDEDHDREDHDRDDRGDREKNQAPRSEYGAQPSPPTEAIILKSSD